MKFNIHANIISRNGSEAGKLTGGTRKCQVSGCTGICYAVRWQDGKLTYPCSKGLKWLNEDCCKLI